MAPLKAAGTTLARHVTARPPHRTIPIGHRRHRATEAIGRHRRPTTAVIALRLRHITARPLPLTIVPRAATVVAAVGKANIPAVAVVANMPVVAAAILAVVVDTTADKTSSLKADPAR